MNHGIAFAVPVKRKVRYLFVETAALLSRKSIIFRGSPHILLDTEPILEASTKMILGARITLISRQTIVLCSTN